MSDNAPLKPIKDRIVIKKASAGGSDLQDCFFLPSEVEGFFNFYDKDGRTLATGISSDVPFPFLLDGIAWTIDTIKINKSHAHGAWRIDSPGLAKGQLVGQDGTFQAESGGGAEEDEVDSAVSSCMPINAIEIKHVHGDSDKDKLKHCYFLPTAAAGEYDLYSKNCNLLQTGLVTDNDFTFTHDSIHWTVTDFKIDDTHASGHWSNPDNITNEQNGTFQAESGGGADEEEATSAASA